MSVVIIVICLVTVVIATVNRLCHDEDERDDVISDKTDVCADDESVFQASQLKESYGN